VQAAIGIAQLEKLDEILARRSAAAARYEELLAGVDEVETPVADDDVHRRSWFVYVVKLAPELDRARVMAELREQGIGTAEYVPCVHLQPYLRERFGFAEGLCPVAEDACARTLALPFFTQLEAEDQERVVEALRAAVET
jgi:dTDP-4-amino-4,6-dideoxygalactose transaminase